MPKAYCPCCRRTTAHKVVMKRHAAQRDSLLSGMQNLFNALLHGDHYMKMEKQCFCRECNSRAEMLQDGYTDVRVI
ncbi:hypothetical protein [Vibrio sp.]|uniref:hypothetical protein n=1 Tax=Vibrio sp. TaxID=678 RepID=UPI003D112CF7